LSGNVEIITKKHLPLKLPSPNVVVVVVWTIIELEMTENFYQQQWQVPYVDCCYRQLQGFKLK